VLRVVTLCVAITLGATPLFADDLLYSYEAEVLPFPEGGWWWGNCVDNCGESVEDGHLVLRWDYGTARLVNYGYVIATSSTPPPPGPPFWIEWRFRSNHELQNNPTCDGEFCLQYIHASVCLFMFGDAVISHSGDNTLVGLPIETFRTYRFESPDGRFGCFWVDGVLFSCSTGIQGTGTSVIRMVGLSGCDLSQPAVVNEWDFARYGRVTYGELIVSSDPPQGFLDARVYAPLDRFTVTFDQANYVLVDEITVETSKRRNVETSKHGEILRCAQNDGPAGVTQNDDLAGNTRPERPGSAPAAPQVTATTRRDNGPPDEVEIVLDRPIPYRATTRFTFDDGSIENVLEFTFAEGDTDGDGDADLADFSWLQNCANTGTEAPRHEGTRETRQAADGGQSQPYTTDGGQSPPYNGPCLALDANEDAAIDPADYYEFNNDMHGP
jgi:hypothetical protein